MIYAIVDLLITVIIVGLMLAILGAVFSISCFASFVKGFFKNIRLVDSVFLFFLLFLSLAFVLNIHIVISGVAALVVAFAVYKVMDTNLGYLIFSILFSPAWAFTFSFIIYIFNRNKLRSGIIFAALLIIAAYAHYSQRDDLFYLDFHLPQREKKPKLKKERIKKVKPTKVRSEAVPDNDIIIGRTETNEAVVVEVVDEEEYEANRFNAWSSRKKYS